MRKVFFFMANQAKMQSKTGQLSLDLPVSSALGESDFFVSSSNSNATKMIRRWQNWHMGKLLLVGPEASGKTHLVNIWATMAKATVIEARNLSGVNIADVATKNVAIENCSAIAGQISLEESLLHLQNFAITQKKFLLLTSRVSPAYAQFSLPDLASRMEATVLAIIKPPDDKLLAAVITKLFADRQISPAPEVVPYLIRRIERSFESAIKIVALLDDAALEQGRSITRDFARRTMDKANF